MPKLRYPTPTQILPDVTRTELKIVLRRLGSDLGFVCPEDWYRLQMEDLDQITGLRELVQNPIHAARILHRDLNPLLFEYRMRSQDKTSTRHG